MLSDKRRFIAALCIVASSVISCGKPDSGTPRSPSDARHTDDKVVNLYIVADYLAPNTLANFENRTGIKVNVSYFDNPETLEARVLAGHSGFDVVLPTSGTFTRQIRSGAYLPFDKSRLPNLGNLDSAIMSKVAGSDPGNAHSVVYMWGTYGIGFNKKLVVERLPNVPFTSWHLVFDPDFAAKLAPCGINFADDPVGVVQLALKYLRRDPGAPSEQDFSDVEKVLLAIRPYIRNIDTSGEIEAMANGDICISLGYSGDFVQAGRRAKEAKNGIQLDYLIPEEGSLVWFDLLAIPRDATHVSNAYQLIDYLMDPHVIADVSNFIGFANANLTAMPLLGASITSNTAIYPTPDEQRRLFVQAEVTPEQSRTITRIWQRFKTGQ
jgi:putrescine transport system substrate-binding protein